MENQNHAFNYAYLLKQVKARVLLAQKKAIYTANEEMLSMYWDIGKLLSESQKQIGWGNNVALMQKVKDIKARYWYMIQCLKNGWSRDFLIEAIKQDYYHSHGALASNFDTTLPEIQAKQVKETLKDPYIFDMLTFTEEYDERGIELGLIKHIEVSE